MNRELHTVDSGNGASMPSRALVVGMGVSGQSVCELLLRNGARVTATDLRSREQFNGALDRLEAMGCSLRLGRHLSDDFLGADQIIVSPGVPLDLPPLRDAARRGIEIVGELDWAWRHVSVPALAVTGTNGKTTTTSLIGEMLKASGKRVFVGGNIGTPLSRWILDGGDADVLVLEVSSFQLDTSSKFRPEVGVLLNITEDHLDRYESFFDYADSKFSLFSRQSSDQVAVINGDDPLCRAMLCRAGRGALPGRLLIAGRNEEGANATLRGREAVVNIPGKDSFSLTLERSALKGVHNEENILAAVLAASSMEASPSAMQEVIDRYKGLPHRVEWVGTWKGVEFYDDSKGTNVGAVVKALENFDRPVLLLLGGKDKLGAYAPLEEPLKARGKAALAFGEAAPRIQRELQSWLPTSSFENLEQVFKEAVARATPGDVVLLSPACSSFDQYVSYAQRGDHFKKLVREQTVSSEQ